MNAVRIKDRQAMTEIFFTGYSLNMYCKNTFLIYLIIIEI